jgi:hypothetical protein
MHPCRLTHCRSPATRAGHDITEREWRAGAHHGAVRCSGRLAGHVTRTIHMLVAVVAQNDIGLVAADPAERQRRNASAAALAVLVVPSSFPKRKPVGIESAALVKDQDSMTAGNGIPPGESGPALQLGELRIWRCTICHEGLQRVEGRDPTSVVMMLAQFLELVIHALSG